MVVFTGLSGSGKSSLAFDTLFAEEVDAAQSLTQRRDIRLLCGRLLGATDDQKLIAAKAANDIFPARDSGESFADLHQKAVAARMAEPIVNGFETIEIDKNKRDLLLLGAGGGKA